MILEYVAANPQTQMVFLVMVAACFIGYLVNRRIMKKQEYDREETKEQRRERFMALSAPKKKPTDIEAE